MAGVKLDCAIFMPLFCRKDTKNINCGKIRGVKFAAIRDFILLRQNSEGLIDIFMPLFLLRKIPLGILHIMLTETLGLILLGLLDKLGRNTTP